MNRLIRKAATYCTGTYALLMTWYENSNDSLLPVFATSTERKRLRSMGFRLRLKHKLKKSDAVLICPPTEPGSLGDQAMIQALIDKLREKGFAIDILINEPNENWSDVVGIRDKILLPRFSRIDDYEYIFRKYRSFYLVGADVLDGYYDVRLSQWLIWLVWFARLYCPEVTITGFSLNESPKPETIEMFKLLPRKVRICCRDPISFSRYRKFVGRKPIQVADLAFLLKPASTNKKTKQYLDWIQSRKKNNGVVVGINISAHSFFETSISTIGQLADLYCKELSEILDDRKDVSFLFLPHDRKGDLSDVNVLTNLSKQLGSNRTRLVDLSLSAKEIKQLASQLDCVVSGRMHLAIACLGSKTPVACVTYQGKFEGLFSFYPGALEYTIPPDKVVSTPNTLKALTIKLIKERESLKNIIKDVKPTVDNLALKNIVR